MQQNRGRNHSRSRQSDAIDFARKQRTTANALAQEVWQMVRNRGCRGQKFRREYPIAPYTADFCCVALRLIIEIDGEPHTTDEGKRHDRQRDRVLAAKGYQVLRIPGYEVLRDPIGVRQKIEHAIDKRIRELEGGVKSGHAGL